MHEVRLAAWLALRSALTRSGETLWRLAVSVAAVVVLLLAVALEPTALARSERIADEMLPLAPVESATSGIRLLQTQDHFEGESILVRRVARVGSDHDWYSARRIPAPGEVVVSPAMELRLNSSSELRRRYPGVIVGVLQDAGTGPRSLVVWQGTEADDLPADAGWLKPGRASSGDVALTVPTEVAYAAPMLIIGFLIPLVALFGLLATLGARRREQRLSALRLLGAAQRTVRIAAGVEAAAVASLGAVGGLLVFVAATPHVAPLLPVEGGVWPEDVRLPVIRVLLALGLLPAIGWVTSIHSVRTLDRSPLAVEQQTDEPGVRRWPAAVLLSGAAGTSAVLAGLVPGTQAPSLVLVVSATALMIGLVGVVPGILLATSRWSAKRTGSVPLLIAARRVAAHPHRASRVATGLTLFVVMVGPLLVFLPLIADAGSDSLTGLGRTAGRGTLLSQQGAAQPEDVEQREQQWAAATRSESVAKHLTLWTVDLAPLPEHPSDPVTTTPVLVADCAALHLMTSLLEEACRQGIRLPRSQPPVSSTASLFVERIDEQDGTVHPTPLGSPFDLPTSWYEDDALAAVVQGLGSPAVALLPLASLGDPSTLERFARSDLVVPAAGRLESARSDIVISTGSVALTIAEREADARRTTREFEVAARVAAGLVIAIALLATCLTAVEVVADTAPVRRQLDVEGAPRSLMRRTLAHQVALPVIVVVIPAALASALLASAFARLVDFTVIDVPLGTIATAAGISAVVPAIAAYLVELVHSPDRHVAAE